MEVFELYNKLGPALAACRQFFGDLALDSQRAARKPSVARLQQKSIEAAAMFNRAQRRGADAHADFALQHIGYQGHIAEVRQKPRPRFVVRMADQVTGLHGLAGQFATAGHSLSLAILRPIR